MSGAPAWLVAAALALGCSVGGPRDDAAAPTVARGRELARAACSGCHPLPSPAVLGPSEWAFVLSYMAFFLGQEQGDGPGHFQRRHPDPKHVATLAGKLALLKGLEVAPTEPALPEADWDAVRAYFVTEAMRGPEPAWTGDAPLPFAMKKLEVRHAREASVVAAVAIDPARQELIFGQFGGRSGAPGLLGVVSAAGEGRVESLVELAGAPVGIAIGGTHDPLAVLTIAGFGPDLRRPRPGALTAVSRDGLVRARLLDQLPRSSAVRRVDLDRDGAAEILLGEFGYGLMGSGAVRAWVRRAGGDLVPQVLWQGDPVVDLEVADLAGDDRPEIVVLTAGAREQVWLLSACDVRAGCASRCIYEQHPAFGFTRVSAPDLDRDGRRDLLLVNGDNTDGGIEGQPRPYHGVRGLRNRADFDFHESFFLPLPGASMAVAEDLDGDGDLDVAAVSAYPSRRWRSLRSFVVFEQTGPATFLPRSFPPVDDARWISIGAGDLDGDGDVDLALGGLRAELGPLPATDWRNGWLRRLAPAEGAPLVILRNESVRRPLPISVRGR